MNTAASPSARLTDAIAAHRAGQLDQAVAGYRAVLAIAPDTLPALTNLGSILRQHGQLEEAIGLLQRAVALPGSNQHAAYNLGNALRAAHRPAEAVAAFRLATERQPGWALAQCNLGVALADMAEWDAAEQALRQALQLEPNLALAQDNLAALLSTRLMAMQYQPMETALLYRQAQAFAALCPPADPMPGRPPQAGQPLRVGFLSPDLCDHPVGMFLLPVLAALDRQRIQPVLYSSGGRDDDTRQALKQQAAWLDVSALDPASLLATLRSHQLDVLVDLSGHTAGHRLAVLARRAAPLQVSWLGYFATTGVPAMDYVLMDRWHVPAGAETQFTEQVAYLPGGRFCYQAPGFAPAVAPPPGMRRGHITFGSFNNPAKYHDGVFDCWAQILAATPNSRLLLKWRDYSEASARQQVWDAFAQRGIDPTRITLRPFSCHAELLGEYADMDIALDPFPFTGGHTSCEALWMGVPVVSWPQARPVSRQTWAFLSALGLTELAGHTGEDYVQIAVDLAARLPYLATLRQTLRARMLASPLCNAAGFARGFETLLAQLYHTRVNRTAN